LCGHFHDKVTRGLISKKTILDDYKSVQTSDDVKRPFDAFDLNTAALRIVLGASAFGSARTLIELDGQNVLSSERPEDGAAFPTLTGIFADREGLQEADTLESLQQLPVAAGAG